MYEEYRDKGLYSSTCQYFYGDKVEYNKRFYIMENDKVGSIININPEHAKYWTLVGVKFGTRLGY